jgi:glutaminase
MSENTQGHIIKYKAGDRWIEIPVAVISVYNMYVAYCEEHNIEPVSETAYYETLGNLENYITQLTGLNDLAASITELTAALNAGALPVNKGGTGHDFVDEKALIQYFKEQLSQAGLVTNEVLEESKQNLQRTIATKLNSNEITFGTTEPSANVVGSIYFQYK